MYQMNIFDLLQEPEPDINELTEAETVERIGNALNLAFKYNSFYGEYEAKIKKLRLSVHHGHYATLDERQGKLFIGVGYDNKKDQSGGASPCDTLKEAINYFKRILKDA